MDATNDSSNYSTIVTYTHSTFHVADYVVFAVFLCISAAVGIYFSCKGHKNTGDYFFGGRQMGAIPVGISNGVSFLSALAIVGLPAEIYINGSEILLDPIVGSSSYFLGGALIALVIYPLNMSSLSEYFAKRFNSRLLTYTANVMVLLCTFQYMGSSMLGSVLALSSVTGGQVSVIVGLIIAGAVGIFYTSIGGLKAVVWTDVIQCGFMLAGIITVVIHSIVDTPGGMPTIIDMNRKYERIHPFSVSSDFTIRHTVWGLTIGNFFYLILYPIQPAGVQRLCSTSTQKGAYLVAAIASILFIFMSSLPMWSGFNIFGYYANRGCDIFKADWIEKNEIILYYVRERLSYPGFQGFFVAALFSGSLSSFSSGLSAASAILWKDTLVPLLPFQVSELKATLISKILVVVFGVLSMIWCYTLYSFGGLILQVTQSVDASMYGAYFGLFAFGIFFRHGNYKGALAGLVASFTFTLWLGLGSLLHGQVSVTDWPSPTDMCFANGTVNSTLSPEATTTTSPGAGEDRSFLETLYSISYVWLSGLCIIVSLLVSLCVSGCTGPLTTDDVKPELIFPVCRSWLCDEDRCSCLSASKDPDSDHSDEEKEKLQTATTNV